MAASATGENLTQNRQYEKTRSIRHEEETVELAEREEAAEKEEEEEEDERWAEVIFVSPGNTR